MVELIDVAFRYVESTDPTPVLQDITLTVGQRDMLGIVGPNGGGKSTLLKLMLGLLQPTRGRVSVFGQDPRKVSRYVGYVPQHTRLDATIPASVLDIVLTGCLGRSSWGFRYPREVRETAAESLRQTGVLDLAHRAFRALSGGQRQRVLIARALASRSRLLLLDEPTVGVDSRAQAALCELLLQLNAHLPIVLVSHDIPFVSQNLRRVACLHRRMTLLSPSEVTAHVIGHLYSDPHAGVPLPPAVPLAAGGPLAAASALPVKHLQDVAP